MKKWKSEGSIPDMDTPEHPVIKGSCLCGRVSYTCSSAPVLSCLCHCKACQKSTGSAFSSIAAVKKSDFLVNGDGLNVFESTGDSGGTALRYFCSTCGSTLYSELSVKPGVIFIKTGTIDEPHDFSPAINFYWDHHQPWINGLERIPNLGTMNSGA